MADEDPNPTQQAETPSPEPRTAVPSSAQPAAPKIPAPPKRVRPSGQITDEAGHIPLTEEFDRAKWTLPPVRIVLIALALVAVVVVAIGWFGRAKPVASGSINDVGAVQVSDSSSLIAIQFTMYNTTEKPLWIKEMGAKVKTDQGEFSDTAASARTSNATSRASPICDCMPEIQCWLKPRSLRAESSMARSS